MGRASLCSVKKSYGLGKSARSVFHAKLVAQGADTFNKIVYKRQTISKSLLDGRGELSGEWGTEKQHLWNVYTLPSIRQLKSRRYCRANTTVMGIGNKDRSRGLSIHTHTYTHANAHETSKTEIVIHTKHAANKENRTCPFQIRNISLSHCRPSNIAW